jgi:hypothetical protein
VKTEYWLVASRFYEDRRARVFAIGRHEVEPILVAAGTPEAMSAALRLLQTESKDDK